MTRSWLSIRVELVEGRGEHLWPCPGRVLVTARTHPFADLALAIDDAFARWDHAHLHEFRLADGTRLTTPYEDDDGIGPALDDRRTRLSRLASGERPSARSVGYSLHGASGTRHRSAQTGTLRSVVEVCLLSPRPDPPAPDSCVDSAR